MLAADDNVGNLRKPRRIDIPGFDPSKYGQPTVSKIESLEPDENAAASTLPASYAEHDSTGPNKSSNYPVRAGEDSYPLSTSSEPRSPPGTFTKASPAFKTKLDGNDTKAMARKMKNRKTELGSSFKNRPQTSGVKELEHLESPEVVLSKLQENEMQKIRFRIRNKDAHGELETTSLRDLELARKTILPRAQLRADRGKDQIVHNSLPLRNGPVEAIPVGGKANNIATSTPVSRQTSSRGLPLMPQARLSTISRSTASKESGRELKVDCGARMKKEKTERVQNRGQREASSIQSCQSLNDGNQKCDLDVFKDQQVYDDESQSSLKPMYEDGNTKYTRPNITHNQDLVGWDGNIQPATLEWNDRPMFNNNTPEFKNYFNNWVTQTLYLIFPSSPTANFKMVLPERLKNYDSHADGIDLIPHEFCITSANASRYGYTGDLSELTKHCTVTTKEDWLAKARLDSSNPLNLPVLNETTEALVQNWLGQKSLQQTQLVPFISTPNVLPQVDDDLQSSSHFNRPSLNLYLRPAIEGDLEQIRDIYNWHVLNGISTADASVAPQDDVHFRFENAHSTRLPIIVAVERGKKQLNHNSGTYFRKRRSSHLEHSPAHSATADDGGGRIEHIVGWASATDLTAASYVERISVELEIYVRPDYRRCGIGRCLMDKLLESCDRGHIKRGGYPFYVTPENSYKYVAGGYRDLHKLFFLVRTWQFPKPKSTTKGRSKALDESKQESDLENAYDIWLKNWIISWGFEVEATLKGVGTRNGRFLNINYFSRETTWQPREGEILA